MKIYWGACKDLQEAINMDETDPNNLRQELVKYEALAKQKDRNAQKKMRGFLNK